MAADPSRSLPDATLAELRAELASYTPADEREAAMRDRVATLLARDGRSALMRVNTSAHLTASAWIVDPARTHAVLMHHRKLDRWLQLGGHVDGEADVHDAALREAREESGLRTLRALGEGIYDIDVHAIPARGDEPAHEHHDLRFAFEADLREPLRGNAESHAVRWVALGDLDRYAIDESVRRLARKTATLPP